jgi:poly(3-hydroxybutyrate) depolymerase/sugar lactone lactonase YvrE
MKRAFAPALFAALAVLGIAAFASPATAAQVTWTGTVDRKTRTALVFPGTEALTTPSPLLLMFHGGGGGGPRFLSEITKVHLAWPEATVVYPQSLDLSAPWQLYPGEKDDQELHFVDTLLKELAATYKVDERRVYGFGGSYGAPYVNFLLTVRPERFAAFALHATSDNPVVKWAKMPRPVLFIHGKLDGIIPIAQGQRVRDQIRRLNGCGTQTVEWAPGAVSYEPCASGQPVIWHEHSERNAVVAGHAWPSTGTAYLVRFFKEHVLPGPPPAPARPVVVDASGTVAGSGKPGTSGDGGLATAAQIRFPESIAVGAGGDLFIADTANNRIRRVGQDGIITRVSSGSLSTPSGLVSDREGNVFVADTYSGRVQKVAADGTISTVVSKAELLSPSAVAVDGQGNLYIADRQDHRIRKVSPDGSLTTVAGTGAAGFTGDGGPATAAQLNAPSGLAVDRQGNLFIADSHNHRVRRLATDGSITTVAGTGTPGFAGDRGPATAAPLHLPTGVAVDSQGNLFIADSLNHRVRRVGVDGVITTVIGGEPGAGSGGALAIPLHYPAGVAVDQAGDVLVADPFHHRVWKVSGVAAPGLIAGKPFPVPEPQ